MKKEKREWRKRRQRSLTPETLARILRQTTVEEDAAEVYERLTGEKIPDVERGELDKDV